MERRVTSFLNLSLFQNLHQGLGVIFNSLLKAGIIRTWEKRNYPLILRGSASAIDANEQTAAYGSLHFPRCTNFVHSPGTLQVPSCVIRNREGGKKNIIHSHFSRCHFFVADLTAIKQAFSLILVLLRTKHNLFLIMELSRHQCNWWQSCCEHILRWWLL